MTQQKIFKSAIFGLLFLIGSSFIFENGAKNNENGTRVLNDKIINRDSPKLDFDTIVHFINRVYSELPTLAENSKKGTQCDWLEKYQEILSSEIVKKYGNQKDLFRIVGITKVNEREYVIFYKNQCRYVNENKISERIKNRFNEIHGCPLPNDKNKIQPPGFKSTYSKLHSNEGEVKSLIQVWHNRKN